MTSISSNRLVSSNELGQPHEFLLEDDGEVLLPVERNLSPIVAIGPALARLPAGRVMALSLSRRRN